MQVPQILWLGSLHRYLVDGLCQLSYVSNEPLRQYLDRLSDIHIGTENGPARSDAYDVSEPKARLYVSRPADSPWRIRAAARTLCFMAKTLWELLIPFFGFREIMTAQVFL